MLIPIILNFTGKFQADQAQQFMSAMKNELGCQVELVKNTLSLKAETLISLLSKMGSNLMISYDFNTLNLLAKTSMDDQDVISVVFYDSKDSPITEEQPEQEDAYFIKREYKPLWRTLQLSLSIRSIFVLKQRIYVGLRIMKQYTGAPKDGCLICLIISLNYQFLKNRQLRPWSLVRMKRFTIIDLLLTPWRIL